jgi:hypothetical protein
MYRWNVTGVGEQSTAYLFMNGIDSVRDLSFRAWNGGVVIICVPASLSAHMGPSVSSKNEPSHYSTEKAMESFRAYSGCRAE